MPDPAAAPAASAAPAADPAAAPAAPAAAPAQPAWHGFNAETDKDAIAYVLNKGWQSPQDVIKSYQGAEKLIGRDPNTLLSIPRADDPAGFLAVMDKLGRPASPDKYEFAQVDGVPVDKNYEAWARSTFHELGLPANVVKALTGKHNEFVKGVLTQQENDYKLAVEADKKALLAEWRGGHERMMNMAQTAAKALGFSGEAIDAIERTVGYAATMKLFAEIGTKLGEHNFVSPEGGSRKFGDVLTPEEAKAQWESFKAVPENNKALLDPSHPGHKQAKEKQTAWFKVMFPDG